MCAAKDYRLHAVFSDAFSLEKRRTMQAYGAIITDVPSDGGKITEALIKAMIDQAGRISEAPGHWWADQLNNRDAIAGYHALGDEIWDQTDGEIDAFVHAVGIAHSIHGVTDSLQRHGFGGQVFAVEPAESAVLSGSRVARTGSRGWGSASCHPSGSPSAWKRSRR